MIAKVDNFSNREIRGRAPKSGETSYIHFAPCNEKTKPNKQTEELNAFQFSFLLFIVLLFFLISGQVILDMLSESDLERHFQPRISIAGI